MTIYEGFQVFMAVADHSMVLWVPRRAVDECSVVSEEITASIFRVEVPLRSCSVGRFRPS